MTLGIALVCFGNNMLSLLSKGVLESSSPQFTSILAVSVDVAKSAGSEELNASMMLCTIIDCAI
jgi:protein-tyrosine-phosphatase